jgi:hypothetical protein
VQQLIKEEKKSEAPKMLPPPTAVKLPGDWVKAHDKDGNVYYFSALENKSQWELPRNTPPPSPPSMKSESDFNATSSAMAITASTEVKILVEQSDSIEGTNASKEKDENISVEEEVEVLQALTAECVKEEEIMPNAPTSNSHNVMDISNLHSNSVKIPMKTETETTTTAKSEPLRTLCDILKLDERVYIEVVNTCGTDSRDELIEWIKDDDFEDDVKDVKLFSELEAPLLKIKNLMITDKQNFQTAFQLVCDELCPFTQEMAENWVTEIDLNNYADKSNDVLLNHVQRVVASLPPNNWFARFWRQCETYQCNKNVESALDMYKLVFHEFANFLRGKTFQLNIEGLSICFFSKSDLINMRISDDGWMNDLRIKWLSCEDKDDRKRGLSKQFWRKHLKTSFRDLKNESETKVATATKRSDLKTDTSILTAREVTKGTQNFWREQLKPSLQSLEMESDLSKSSSFVFVPGEATKANENENEEKQRTP